MMRQSLLLRSGVTSEINTNHKFKYYNLCPFSEISIKMLLSTFVIVELL